MTQRADTPQRPGTKIVCTLGPSTNSAEMIRTLILNGLTVARLNLSHGTSKEHRDLFNVVRAVSEELEIPVGIMVDVPGPKYRTGPQSPGEFYLESGNRLVLTSDDIVGSEKRLGVFPPGIHEDVEAGDRILVDDGAVELQAVSVQGTDVTCSIVDGGRVTERRGVTIPGKTPSLPFLDDRANSGPELAADLGADFVALSNVTRAENIIEAKQVLFDRDSKPFIISKIETEEAISNFDELLRESDCVMVARGDMGVEVELELVPVIQKRLIDQCNRAGKPVITATQMLESMVKSPTPTRAEVTDVANAIYDGTDAVMLSGETSVGDFPDRAVDVMRKVALNAEYAIALDSARRLDEKERWVEQQTDDAIAYDAARIANQLEADVIVAFTESGGTARRVSKYRPKSPILALTPHESVRRKLTVSRGVEPVIGPQMSDVEEFFGVAETHALNSGWLEGGGKLVLTAGIPIGEPGSTNFLHVMDVPDRHLHESVNGAQAQASAD